MGTVRGRAASVTDGDRAGVGKGSYSLGLCTALGSDCSSLERGERILPGGRSYNLGLAEDWR
jgi:hypothetical protein